MDENIKYMNKAFSMIENAMFQGLEKSSAEDNILKHISRLIDKLYQLQDISPEEIDELYNAAIVALERIEDYFESKLDKK